VIDDQPFSNLTSHVPILSRRRFDLELGFVKAGTSAGRAFPRFPKLLWTEGESTRAALGRSNEDVVPGGLGRPDDMPQILLDIVSTEAELAGDGRNGPRLSGQMYQKVLAEGHVRVYALRHLAQFRDAPDFDPLHDVQITLVIEAGAVRTDELTRYEPVARLPTERIQPVRGIGVPKVRDDLIAVVDQRDPAVQIGNDDQAMPFIEMTWQTEARDEIDMGAIEGKPL
jgi:hypothetical protein